MEGKTEPVDANVNSPTPKGARRSNHNLELSLLIEPPDTRCRFRCRPILMIQRDANESKDENRSI